jgi:DNA-binding ferritin-like protein (Dps family)
MSEHCHQDHSENCCHHHEHQEASCCSHEHHCHEHHHHGSFADQLIHVADEAWMDLLKEKMKKQIEAQTGKHMDELAKIVTEENEKRWKNKMTDKNFCDEYRDKINEYYKK